MFIERTVAATYINAERESLTQTRLFVSMPDGTVTEAIYEREVRESLTIQVDTPVIEILEPSVPVDFDPFGLGLPLPRLYLGDEGGADNPLTELRELLALTR